VIRIRGGKKSLIVVLVDSGVMNVAVGSGIDFWVVGGDGDLNDAPVCCVGGTGGSVSDVTADDDSVFCPPAASFSYALCSFRNCFDLISFHFELFVSPSWTLPSTKLCSGRAASWTVSRTGGRRNFLAVNHAEN